MERPATPPTVPPTIAPVFEDEDDEEEEEEEEEVAGMVDVNVTCCPFDWVTTTVVAIAEVCCWVVCVLWPGLVLLLPWVCVAEFCPEVAVLVEPVLVSEVLFSELDDDEPVGGALLLLELSLVGEVLLLLLDSVVLDDEDEEVVTDDELDVAVVAVV